MAGYKVPQDVEAEDKFLGPLTFKQFLYAGGGAVSGYILFILMTKEIWIGFVLLLPIFLIFAILAFPWSKDQSTEIWLASRIRFMIVPRKRVWDQSGIKDLVKITVPKREIKHYSDGLSRTQVYSRVDALANMIDTRGWAVKNVSIGRQSVLSSDRLVDMLPTMPDVRDNILHDADDAVEEQASHLGAQFDDLIRRSDNERKQSAQQIIDQARRPAEQALGTAAPTVISPTSLQPVDPIFAAMQQHHPTIQKRSQFTEPATSQSPVPAIALDDPTDNTATTAPVSQPYGDEIVLPPVQSTSTTPVTPAIMQLSNNDDLTVATIARQAHKSTPDDEVVVNLR